MGKFNTVIAFFAGVTVGGAAVWYMTKERYAQLAEEEINSVKEAYAHMGQKKEKADEALRRYQGKDEDVESPKTPVAAVKVVEKRESISEYAERVKNGGKMDYSQTVVQPKVPAPEENAQSEASGDVPYVISPEEFDDLEGYTPISLTYFADGVLADEYGVVVDDVEEIIGDGLNHFGEYDDDAVYVRNDAKRCDYEVLRDERTYEEFRETLPTKI